MRAVILLAISIALAYSARADYTDLAPGVSGYWIGQHEVEPAREWTRLEWVATPWAPLPADFAKVAPAPWTDLTPYGSADWETGLAAGEFVYGGQLAPSPPDAVWLSRPERVGFPAGMAGRWTFDDSGSPGADSSGNGRHLSLVGTAAWTASGMEGGGIAFGDNTARLNMAAWAHGGSYTLAVWVKGIVASAVSRTLFAGGTSQRHMYLTNASAPTENLAMYDTAARSSLFRVGAADYPQWTLLAVVGTGGTSTFWINGRPVGQVSYAVTTSLTTIGNFATGGERFAATLDEAVAYGRALSDGEMAQLAEAFAWRHSRLTLAAEGTPGQLTPETWGWDGDGLHVRLYDDADPDDTIPMTVQSGPASISETATTQPVGLWHFEETASPFAAANAGGPDLAASGTVETRQVGIWDYAVRMSPGAALAAGKTASMDCADLTIHAWIHADATWMAANYDATVVGRAAPASPWRVVLRPNAGDPVLQLAILRDGLYEYGPSIRVQALRLDGWTHVAWTFDSASGSAAAYSCGRMVDVVELTAAALPSGDGGMIVGAPFAMGVTELAVFPWAISAYEAMGLWLRGATGSRGQISTDGGLTWMDDAGVPGGYMYSPGNLSLPSATADFRFRFQLWSYDWAATPVIADIRATYISDIPTGAAVSPIEPLAIGTGNPLALSHQVSTAGGQVRYRISPTGPPTWYWWTGTQWAEAVDPLYNPATTNSPAELAAGLPVWREAFPDAPDLYWLAFLDSGGTYQVTLDTVSLTYAGGYVAVTAPVADQLAEYGQPLAIAWTAGGDVSGLWSLAYSVDGVAWVDIATNVAGSSYFWSPPAAAESITARVRVRDAADPAIQAASDPFWIAPPPIRFTSPAGGADIMAGAVTAIAWSVRSGVVPSADCVLEFSTDGGQAWSTIAVLDGTAGQPPDPWTAPVLTSPLMIRLRDSHVPANTATVSCSVRIGYVVSIPARVYAGAVCPVQWTASVGSWPVADFHYSLDAGRTWTAIDRVASVPGQSGHFNWVTPRVPATSAWLRIRSVADRAQAHQAATTLAMLRIDEPVADQTALDGHPLVVRWTSAGAGDAVDIQYATSDSLAIEPTTWQTIAAAAPNSGSYTWTVSAWPTSRARVRIRSVKDIHIEDISPAFNVEIQP